MSVPSAIVGSSDHTATLLYALANQAGESLARRPEGGWVQMIREFDFTTAAIAQQSCTIANSGPGGVAVISGLTGIGSLVANSWVASGTGIPYGAIVTVVTSTTVTINSPATQTGAGRVSFGQSDYALPSDYQRAIDNTFWDRSRFWAMRGPQSPQQWQLYKSSMVGKATVQRRYRFRSANWLSGGTGTPGQAVLSIDPVPFDNGAALVFEYASNAWCASATGTPQKTWQADTDVGILDEYLLQLGLQWRFLRRLGLSYNEEMDEYESAVSVALARDGSAPILNLTPNDQVTLLGPWNLPETNFGNIMGSP